MSKLRLGTRMAYTTEVGRARYELYRGAHRRLKQALSSGFWIEAIALCESMISDRLESRISHLNNHESEARRHQVLGGLVNRLKSTEKKRGYAALHALYEEVRLWNAERNRAIHHAVKISDGEAFRKWDERYSELEETARTGSLLVQRLSDELKRIKLAEERKQKERTKKQSLSI